MQTLAQAVMENLSFLQVLGWGGSIAGSLFAFWKFYLQSQLTSLKLSSESNFRYRELWDQQQQQRWAEFRKEIAEMRVLNKELHDQLTTSETEKIDYLRKIGELTAEITALKAMVASLTAEVASFKGRM